MEHGFSDATISSAILSESLSKQDLFVINTQNVMTARLNVRFRHVPLPLLDFSQKANPRSTGFDAIKMRPQIQSKQSMTLMTMSFNHYFLIWSQWAK